MKMVDVAAGSPEADAGDATDAQLVRRCLANDEEAWVALVHRYKRLIYAIPFKFGISADHANDIFQAVCVDLVSELPKLRNPDALRAWLVSVTRHRSLRWKTRMRREQPWDTTEALAEVLPDDDLDPVQLMEEVQREQAVRDAIEGLPQRCREMVRMLFYGSPPVPYAEVARRLGLATGSIGFIRGRCLKKLEAALRARGL